MNENYYNNNYYYYYTIAAATTASTEKLHTQETMIHQGEIGLVNYTKQNLLDSN
jgi:hypothetical protein